MKQLTRITLNPNVMGGKPCIRGLRVTVGTIVGLLASGHSIPQVLAAYPYLEDADIRRVARVLKPDGPEHYSIERRYRLAPSMTLCWSRSANLNFHGCR